MSIESRIRNLEAFFHPDDDKEKQLVDKMVAIFRVCADYREDAARQRPDGAPVPQASFEKADFIRRCVVAWLGHEQPGLRALWLRHRPDEPYPPDQRGPDKATAQCA